MSGLRRQIELLLTAVQFLTRLPTPHLRRFQPDWPVRATRFFPLVGHGVGLLSATVWLLASHVWSAPVAATLAVATSALATGGFHEDGLADAFDALGGATPARRLAIMKGSRIGSYGALALLVSGALRLGALATLPPLAGALALVVAHGAARAAAVCVMRLTPYAGDVEGAKGRPADARVGAGEALFAALGLRADPPARPFSRRSGGGADAGLRRRGFARHREALRRPYGRCAWSDGTSRRGARPAGHLRELEALGDDLRGDECRWA